MPFDGCEHLVQSRPLSRMSLCADCSSRWERDGSMAVWWSNLGTKDLVTRQYRYLGPGCIEC